MAETLSGRIGPPLVAAALKCAGIYLLSSPAREHNTAIRVNVGDKVRSDKGVEGEMVGVTPDGYSAWVRLAGDEKQIVSLPLAKLVRIDKYTSHTGEPPA